MKALGLFSIAVAFFLGIPVVWVGMAFCTYAGVVEPDFRNVQWWTLQSLWFNALALGFLWLDCVRYVFFNKESWL